MINIPPAVDPLEKRSLMSLNHKLQQLFIAHCEHTLICRSLMIPFVVDLYASILLDNVRIGAKLIFMYIKKPDKIEANRN